MLAGRLKDWGFWIWWRIPHVRKYQVEFEMNLTQFLFGFYSFGVGFSLCLGPFEISIVRRCDCCP